MNDHLLLWNRLDLGKRAFSLPAHLQEANLQKVMTRIGAICLITIGVWIIIELAVQFGHYGHACYGGAGERPARLCALPCAPRGLCRVGPGGRCGWVSQLPAVAPLPCTHPCLCPSPLTGGCPTLTNMLVIVVGGIPIAMPTVLSVTLALGAFVLAKEGAIVSRMSGEGSGGPRVAA